MSDKGKSLFGSEQAHGEKVIPINLSSKGKPLFSGKACNSHVTRSQPLPLLTDQEAARLLRAEWLRLRSQKTKPLVTKYLKVLFGKAKALLKPKPKAPAE